MSYKGSETSRPAHGAIATGAAGRPGNGTVSGAGRPESDTVSGAERPGRAVSNSAEKPARGALSGQPKGNRKHILVVDDEPKILDALASFLVSRGFIVSQARTGREALAAFARNSISLIVLDLMLPDMSGEDVCTVIRRHSRVPIIMLTAKSDEASHVSGIGLGADDYLVKPFRLGVLIAHIEAILRRSETDLVPLMAKSSWRNGDLVVDFAQGTVLKGGMLISLTKKERNILATLIKYPGKVFTREELLRIAFGYDFFGNDRVIDTHIKNLRKKLEDDPKSPVYIRTIHGLGYQFGGS